MERMDTKVQLQPQRFWKSYAPALVTEFGTLRSERKMSSLGVVFSLEETKSHTVRGLVNAGSDRSLWSVFGRELPHIRHDVRGRVVRMEQPSLPSSCHLGAKLFAYSSSCTKMIETDPLSSPSFSAIIHSVYLRKRCTISHNQRSHSFLTCETLLASVP